MNNKVICDIKDGIMSVILNNPDKMNCIGFDMIRDLDRCLELAERSEEVKVLIVRGKGEKAFSSGADLKEFKSLSSGEMDKWIIEGNTVFNRLETIPKPTVAFITGYTIGGGLELALCCDFRVGTPNALIFTPEVKSGWLPGWGGMTRLRRLSGEIIAKEIILLGTKIDAERALSMSLLNRVFRSDNPENELLKFVSYLKDINPQTYVLAKRVLEDNGRTTDGSDLSFDILALRESLRNQ
jgi:enoyl-CoA hydratase/carnithine racemase